MPPPTSTTVSAAPVQRRELLHAGTTVAAAHRAVEGRPLGGIRREPAPEVVAEDPQEHGGARPRVELPDGPVPDAADEVGDAVPAAAA